MLTSTVAAWRSAHVIATIVAGGVALVVFVLYEVFVPLKEPYIPMHLFKNLAWVAATVVVCVGAMAYYAFRYVKKATRCRESFWID
jgi:hypothetical protein